METGYTISRWCKLRVAVPAGVSGRPAYRIEWRLLAESRRRSLRCVCRIGAYFVEHLSNSCLAPIGSDNSETRKWQRAVVAVSRAAKPAVGAVGVETTPRAVGEGLATRVVGPPARRALSRAAIEARLPHASLEYRRWH